MSEVQENRVGERCERPRAVLAEAGQAKRCPPDSSPRRLDRRWILLLQGTAAVAMIGIPVSLLFPSTTPLLWFALMAVPANSPLGPVLPCVFEPLIIGAVRYAPAVAVTLTGLAVFLYMEHLNWHLYRWILHSQRFSCLNDNRWIGRGVKLFGRSPFWAVVLAPFPFWVARVLAILHGYPLRRYLLATAVGRLPRIGFCAWLGSAMVIPPWVLVAVVLVTTGAVLAARLLRQRRLLEDMPLDTCELQAS